MSDETTTNLVEGGDTALAIDTSDTGVGSDSFGTETEQFDDDGNPIEDHAADDESEEVDYEGKKYKIARELKDALLRQADYTRKTQEVAEARKAIEAERANLHQASNVELQARAQVVAIDQSLAQYQNVDWDTWEQQSPFEAQKGWRQFQQLQQARQNAVGQIGQLAQQRTLQQQQETARRLEEGRQVLARDIKGWGPELAESLLGTAEKQYGFKRAEAEESISDPRLMKVLHDAHQWQQHQKKTQAAQVHVTAQRAEPAAKVTRAAAPVQGLDDRLSIDEWTRRREAQVRKRGT